MDSDTSSENADILDIENQEELLSGDVSTDLGILIVDDDPIIRQELERRCTDLLHGKFKFFHASNIKDTFEILHRQCSIRLVLLDKDLKLSDGTVENGIEAMPDINLIRPVAITVVSGSKLPSDVLAAMKNKAITFIPKDCDEKTFTTRLRESIWIVRRKIMNLRAQLGTTHQRRIVGKSNASRLLRKQVLTLGTNEKVSILITGKSGSGKSEIAAILHELFMQTVERRRIREGRSPCNDPPPFVGVDMGALTESLLESELFGHEKGAFTGAVKLKRGAFEMADGGVIFLDEIGNASDKVQAALLRILDHGNFRRVGGEQEIHTEVKVIAATNKDLKSLVNQGKFREDLYYRLKVAIIEVPSLIDRKEDLSQIIRSIWPEVCKLNGTPIPFESCPRDLLEFFQKNIHKIEGQQRDIKSLLFRLFLYSPKDDQGNPILTRWKKVNLFTRAVQGKSNVSSIKGSSPIRVSDLLKHGIDFDDPGFSELGISGFIRSLKQKLYKDAKRQFRNTRKISQAFKISDSQASITLQRFGLRTEIAKTGGEQLRAGSNEVSQ